jgi:ABC-type transport system involved in multi-copper enzyme maturation permease subunit
VIMGKNFSPRRIALEALIITVVGLFGLMLERTLHPAYLAYLVYGIVWLVWPAPGLFAWYYRKSPWRASAIGRALMTFAVTFFVYLTFVVSSFVVGDYPGREAIRIVVYLLVGYSLWRMLYTLRRSQIRAAHQQRAEAEHVERRYHERRKA